MDSFTFSFLCLEFPKESTKSSLIIIPISNFKKLWLKL
jgi:hypothetical protein